MKLYIALMPRTRIGSYYRFASLRSIEKALGGNGLKEKVLVELVRPSLCSPTMAYIVRSGVLEVNSPFNIVTVIKLSGNAPIVKIKTIKLQKTAKLSQ